MTPDDAVRQAGTTIAEYLDRAVAAIDEKFGDGYAKANPALVGAFIQACATDFNSWVLANNSGGEWASDSGMTTAEALTQIACELEEWRKLWDLKN